MKYKGSAADVEIALMVLEQGYRLSLKRKLFKPPPKKKVFPRRAKRKPKNFKKPNLDNIYLIQFAEDIDVEALAKDLMEDPQVEYAHPNYILTTLETIPNDPNFLQQWALKNTGQTGGTPGADIKATYAWDLQKGDPNIVVAIVDTGVDYDHPDLVANIWVNPGEDFEPLGVIGPEDFNGVDDDGNGYIDDIRGWDFVNISGLLLAPKPQPGEDAYTADNDPMDFDGHGTNCSGVLADSNNATGVAGVAWNSRIMPIKIGYAAQGYSVPVMLVNVAAGAIYYTADNGADVISMSFGGFSESGSVMGAFKDAINYAYAEGCVLVGGAANRFYGNLRHFPSAWDNVIAVAASDHNDQRSVWYDWGVPERHSGSNYAPWVDVVAPGSDIYTTEVGGGYLPDYGGTSSATPHAAATAAMVLSQEPNLTNEDVMWIMRRSADDIAEPGRDLLGYGRINVLEALNCTNKSVLKASIDSPEVSSYISNINDMPISGYASGQDFNDYMLEWGVGKEPNSWTLLTESNTPVEDGVLGYWDTNSPDRNFYTLKLTVTDSNAEAFDYRHTVLLNPDLVPGWPVSIEGCMYHSSVTVADIDDDNDMEILGAPYCRQISRSYDGGTEVFAFHHDGSMVSGWPKEYYAYIYEATPAIADVDGDGSLEVAVALEYNGNKVALLRADGSNMPEWPQSVTDEGFYGAVAIFDLDGIPENGLEIIAVATNKDDDYGKVYAWYVDGTLVSGWPQDCYKSWGTPAVADVDADGKGEIFIGAYDNKMYAFNDDGTTLAGNWPITVGAPIFSSPAIADIDDDGEYEIIVGCKDYDVYAWNVNGTAVTGWPQTTNGVVWSSPAIGDIDGDGGLDVVVGSEDANVYAWHGDGTPVAGWPVTTGGEVKSSAAIGDIDGDGQVEVVIGSFDKNIYAFNGDGSIVSDWPIITTGTTFCTAAIYDVDNDGDVDLTFGSNDFKIYVFDINAPYDPNKMPWPTAHHDAQNTGCYPLGRPTVVDTQPTNEDFVCVARQIEVTFSEPVANVSADDLTLSSGTVLAVSGANEGPYVFDVIETEPGSITAMLDGDIRDLDGIDMAPHTWSFAQTTIASDFDCNGQVNFRDFAELAMYWLDADCHRLSACAVTDLDYSTQIDTNDLGVFVEDWLYDYWGGEHALFFDGNDRVIISNTTSLNPSAITIECWVNFAQHSGAQFLVCKGSDREHGAYRLIKGGIEPGTHWLTFSLGRWWDGYSASTSGLSLGTDQWYHVAGTYDGQTLRLYLDGNLVASKSIGVKTVGNSYPLYFSYNDLGGSYPYYLTGQLDEVRIWNYTRREEQLQAAMHRVLTGEEYGLVGYWRLNEGTGQVISDSSSGGSNGRLGETTGVDPDDPTWVLSTVPFQLGP